MEEEIVKGEEFVAVPEEKEAVQAPAEVVDTPVEASAEPVEASVEENQVVNPAPEAEIPEPVEAPEPTEPTETPEPAEPSEVSESTEPSEPSEPVAEAEVEAEPAALLTSGADVIAKLKSLPNFGVSIARDELEHLKQAFYRWHNAAISEVKDAFVVAGNDADAFVPADRCPGQGSRT